MKKILLIPAFLFLTSVVHAQSIQLSTYYPSPFGKYDRIQLVPRPTLLGGACDAGAQGTLYIDETSDQVMLCDAANWVPLIASGSWTENVVANTLYVTNTARNVGIGTTSPVNKLDVEGSVVIGATYSGTNAAPANGLLVEGNVGIGMTGSTTSRLWVTQSNPANTIAFFDSAGYGVGINAGTSATDYALQIQNAAVTANYFTVRGDGNVGIGTTAPTDTLTINGDIGVAGNTFLEGNLNLWDGAVAHVDSGMSIYAWNNQAAYAFLQGAGDADNYAALSLADNSNPAKYWQMRHGKSAAFLNKFNFAYYNGTAWSYPMTIDTTGNVGIGTAAPGARLDVQGGDINTSGAITAAGIINANAGLAATGAPITAGGGLVIETRTTNPLSPATGQMWLCTDAAPYCDGS